MPQSRSRSHRRDGHSRHSSRELSCHSHRVSDDDRHHCRSRSRSPVDRRHESRHLRRSPRRGAPRAVSHPEHHRSPHPPAGFRPAHVRSVVSRRRSRSFSLSHSRSGYGTESERVTVTVKFASEEVIDRFLSNVDVWQTIFEMLEVKDRIRLEMTNKRLGILMFEYWKRVTSFDTGCLTWIGRDPSINKNRWEAFFAICVNRIGDGLRSLTISEISTYLVGYWSTHFSSIGEGCPNVETINFIFEDNHMDENEPLHICFDAFSRLKTLTVSPNMVRASASVFLSIPVSIEVIRGLKEGAFENAAQMEGFFADRPSLRQVYLRDLFTCDRSEADIFRVIAERCPYLKSIKLSYYDNCIDYCGVVALESMNELCIPNALLDEIEFVTICERSPLVEALDFRFRFTFNPQSAALNALGALTKLDNLRLRTPWYMDVAALSLVTEFVRELTRNSGPSLRHLDLPKEIPLSTAAIEALANGCGKLRYIEFSVRAGEATPASIRFFIDCIVAHPSWIHQTGERTLMIIINVTDDGGDDAEAGRAAFKPLADPTANLPAGVQLRIN